MQTNEFSDGEIPLMLVLPLLHRLIMSCQIPKKFGLTKAQMVILSVLSVRGQLNMSQVADCLAASKEQATRAVAPLVEQGLVERFEETGNRTHVFVRLTSEGVSFIRKYRHTLYTAVNEKLDTTLGQEDRQSLREAIGTIVSVLGKMET